MTKLHADSAHSIPERRKYVRVHIYAVTRYFCPERNAEVGIQTQISDISEGGVKLLTFMEGIPIGTEVHINFILPGKDSALVSIEGQVRHTGPLEKDLFRSGVQYLKVKEKDRLAIRKFIAHQKK